MQERKSSAMPEHKRLRRCLKVCLLFAGNLAYYRARRETGSLALPDNDFCNAMDGNFIDAAVLEWCKLFGDPKAPQGWRKIVADPQVFESELLVAIGRSPSEFNELISKARTYRDKFIAHLDSDLKMYIPDLEDARKATAFYYWYLWNRLEPAFRTDVPADFAAFYQSRVDAGVKVYAQLMRN
jgi:hypothetical protein